MRDGEVFVMGGIVGAIFCLICCLPFLADGCGGKTQLRRQAIEHGYARYNSETGVWQWNEPVEKEKP
jgi:hypothetical protein